MFLVGAISYLIAVGLYILFLSPEDDPSFKRFRIKKLADLESKIVGLVAVTLAVGFVGKAAESPGPLALLQGGAGVALVIGALCLILKVSETSE